MINGTLVEVSEHSSKKTGEVTYLAVLLSTFSDFGKTKKSTVDFKLTHEQYVKLKPLEGKRVDFYAVLPLPTFPLILDGFNVDKG